MSTGLGTAGVVGTHYELLSGVWVRAPVEILFDAELVLDPAFGDTDSVKNS